MDTRQKSEIAFKEFFELIQKLTSHDKDLHRRLQKSYDQTNPHFRWSRGFINLVSLCSEKVRDTPEKRLLHVKEFINELHNYKAKPLKHLIKNASCVSDSDDSSTEELPLSPILGPTESPKAFNVLGMEVDVDNENESVVGSDGTVDGRGVKRKSSYCPEEQNDEDMPSVTGNQNDEAECRKKKRMFYNSTSLSGLMTISYPRMRGPRNETSVITAADIICLDDDDDYDDVEGGLSSEKGDFDKSCTVNVQEKRESQSKATDSSIQSSIVTFKPGAVLSKRSDNVVGIGTNHLKTNADALHGNRVEVICLDDDEDDDRTIGKVDAQVPQPLEIDSNPVRRPADTSVTAGVDVDVIEITDADENHSEEKLLPLRETEKQSQSVRISEDEATSQFITEIHSNTLGIDYSDNISDVEAIETVVDVDTKACDAVEERSKTSIEEQSSRQEMAVNNGHVDDHHHHHRHHPNDGKTMERQIRHLEHQLQKLNAEIQRRQQTELTLDDMNSDASDYIRTDRLKRNFLKVWKRLCKMFDLPALTGQVTERQISVEISGYPDIGKEVSNFINKDTAFPDYQDIYDIVVSCNDMHSLFLTDAAVERLSEKIFTHVGNRLQQLRRIDLAEQMKAYLPDTVRSYDDPAMYDQDLIEKLEESQAVGKTNLEQVFKSFSEKQDTNGETMVDKDEDKMVNEDDTDEDDSDEDDSEDHDSEDEHDNNESVFIHDLRHLSDVELSSEAESCPDSLEHSKFIFEDEKVHGTDEYEYEDDDDERGSHKETIFINFDDGRCKAAENAATTRSISGVDGLGTQESDCNESAEQELGSLNARGRSMIIIDEETDASSKVTSCSKQHTLNCSQLKIRSELLDNIRRLTSNISFSEASSLSQSRHETDDEADEKTGGEWTDATSDRCNLDVEGANVFHMNANEKQSEPATAIGSDLTIPNDGSWRKEEDQIDPTNDEFVGRTATHQKEATFGETVVWKQDNVEKTGEAEIDVVHMKDSVAHTDDATTVVSFSSNCTLKMASDPFPVIEEEASACSVMDVITTTAFIICGSLTPKCLDIPLLEEISQKTTDSTSKETDEAETPAQVRAVTLPSSDGQQQLTTGVLLSPEAAGELIVEEVSDVSHSAAQSPPMIISAAERVASCASDLTTEQHMSLSLDYNTVQTNGEFDFSIDRLESYNVLDEMVQSQCSSKSNIEDLFPDEICSTSDLELRLDTSSESPDDPPVSRSSSLVDLKKPILEDALEKPKGLLDVLREASKRELLAEASSLHLRNSICEDSINLLEMDVHVEAEQGFSRLQQLYDISKQTVSSDGYSAAAAAPTSEHQTLQSSQETDQLSSEPSICRELHAEKKQCEEDIEMCKDEAYKPIISPVSFHDHCKESVLQVDQNSKREIPITTILQSEDTISESKENIIELDSDLE